MEVKEPDRVAPAVRAHSEAIVRGTPISTLSGVFSILSICEGAWMEQELRPRRHKSPDVYIHWAAVSGIVVYKKHHDFPPIPLPSFAQPTSPGGESPLLRSDRHVSAGPSPYRVCLVTLRIINIELHAGGAVRNCCRALYTCLRTVPGISSIVPLI